MRCYGLMIPGSETARFYSSPLKPEWSPILRFKPVSRIPIGSFKTKTTINAKITTEWGQMTLYELLGIPKSGTFPEIKQAYKQLARKYHPDVSPPGLVEEYTRRFIRVQEAYETLSDPRMKEIYDRDMARGLHLAFSARRRYPYQNDEEMEGRSEWKNCWQSQLSELKRRSTNKDAGGSSMSWAARMRRRREGLSEEL
ncbi:PREDICTED: chaperone protein dnaJ 20, chloroplastic-like isoform X2 [Populus euphratica]|uniref:Chaperone protein dnaJ 20, chloroplastic-like isoform X2 n=1 Tax=Populus euphratica TaxID=75702 RepID=A0AAJ6X2S2_POPEU|nr:PREDICTED: chaperone protein dnaJ 20, chloroplastic-like isoform X2 [Populus euphratica]